MLGKSILVSCKSQAEISQVQKLGCKILATYTQTILVRGTEAQFDALREMDFKLSEVPAKSWYTIVERISE